MKRKFAGLLFLMSTMTFVAAGCTGSEVQQATTGESAANKPVTLKVASRSGYLTDEEFQKYIAEPVKKKYPWITVERVMMLKKGENLLPDLIVAGQTPDLIILSNMDMSELKDLDLAYPLEEHIKKDNLDVNRFEPFTLDAIKMSTISEQLVALPYTMHFSALYYNKDIFDKFGVEYPKDGMTWDEITELAKKVTRNVDDIQYRGLEPNIVERPASQLSIPFVDPNTNKAVLNTDQWKKVMNMLKAVYDIPGNNAYAHHSAANDQFTKTRTLAMLASNNILFDANLDKVPDLNWDMVSYPTWKEKPGVGIRVDEHVLAIAKTSPHKDDAFKVISTVVSDEVQLSMSKQGRVSTLKDKKVKDAFGSDISFMKGKNIQAIYKTTPAPGFVNTQYYPEALSAMVRAVRDEMVKNGKDVNTILRDAEELANKNIQTKITGKK